MKKIVLLAFLSVLLSLTIFEAQFVAPLKATGEPPIEVWTDYTLDRDISFSGDGFIIKANDVVLNLNGHTISGCGMGIGIRFYYVSGVTVKNGVVKQFERGIQLWYSSNCSVFDNNANNNEYGIQIHWGSSSNVLRNNSMTDNSYNFDVRYPRYEFPQDIDVSNTVNEKPIYYLVNQHDLKVPADAGYLAAIDSTNITVEDLILTNNGQGALFDRTTNSTIKNVTTTNNWYGIRLWNSSNCFVSNNNASNNHRGIYLEFSNNNSIVNNCAFLNGEGITLSGASSNYIAGNNVSRRTSEVLIGVGIILYEDSEFNTIVRNNVSDVNYGIDLGGKDCRWNIVSENFVSLCYFASIKIYYGSWNNITENVIVERTGGFTAGIEVDNGQWNQVLRNQISKMGVGIYLLGSPLNSIQGNNISNSGNGIYIQMQSSHNNNITENSLMDNACGIKFDNNASNNIIHHNNFIGNKQHQALCEDNSTNTWNNGTQGNYWSDYTGRDRNGDGIGDMRYMVNENNQDNYPLMSPWGAEEEEEEKVPFWMQWWLWTIVAVVIVALAGAAYFLKKRKPPTPTAPTLPTEVT